ncbi:hypothetical protein L210DRAFT_980508 [Boletus edulis BED1]|uniref:Uncharacterized protein n=1 Tax=Boletus edulis BED1 TaxID=1328754 RepID=A0AAD4BSQ3_BOLED|nr:hypothetical protein L210DRAFT_980508 [Boletus edulis BED1]
MSPSAVVEQQAKLGVSAEESKAQRLKRQQARFRDRGGVFVPSTSNPLVDILLARTVSGDSPSKPRPKDIAGRRSSTSRPRQSSPTRKARADAATEKSQAVAGSSKSKPASRKRKAKVVEAETDPDPKPAPKRRGRPAQSKKKAQDSDAEQLPPANTNTNTNIKSKPTSKGKGKQRAAPSTSDGHPKTKPKPKTKAKAKSNPAKEVIEVFDSDDEQTLVEAPHKVKSNPKRKIPYEDDDETDDDAPIIRKRAVPCVDDSKASGTKTATRVKTGKIVDTGNSRKISHDKEEDVAAPPAKKRRAANLLPAKPKTAIEPEPALRPIRDVSDGGKLKATGKDKGKGRIEPVRDVVEPVERDDDERPPERVSKHKKRKKEEDNHDDQPRKTVKFSDTGPPHSSSRKLKENQPNKKGECAAKSGLKDEPDAPKLASKPPIRAKTPKGPPREVLERIKASAVRHFRCVDSEPDELDCLS